jgi:hypothetical protein
MVYFFRRGQLSGRTIPLTPSSLQIAHAKSEASFRRFVHAVSELCGPASIILKMPVRSYVFMNEPEGYATQFYPRTNTLGSNL